MNKKMKIEAIGITVAAFLLAVSMASDRSTYIIRTVEPDGIVDAPYMSSLHSVAPSAKVIYMYQHVLNGYSARLTPEEALALKAMPNVVSVSSETRYELHTTRTPWFLGLDQHTTLLPNPELLSDVIIGVLDSGVWPESKSFDDTGLGPIPSHWRGECETGKDFNKSHCNRKLIGARSFYQGYEQDLRGKINETLESKSPRDNIGHGTHTSTTAAGSVVPGASLFGYANGTARGMAPQARVAVYKCCWKGGCLDSDILAAMDRAIEDNVNVMSLSLGSGNVVPYYADNIAIGAFSAMENGIFVSCSAGNSGPDQLTLSNTAPWITTVGAGTLDRDFPTTVTLGNGKTYYGVSLYSGKQSLGGKNFPFVYAGDVTNGTYLGRFCKPGSLIPEKVKGKIVLCDRGENPRAEKSNVVKAAGGVGTILPNFGLVADAHLYPTTTVGWKAGNAMRKYLSSDPNPTATISFFQGTRLGIQPSPVVAAFSSRGPVWVTPEILKPDLIAPGVGILAGWTGDVGPSTLETDMRRVPYNIISGTSMSCPHVSGLAAILKAAHPNWSPAAIRSALMTTAYTEYKDGNPIIDEATGKPSTPFDHGAGHVNPIAALDPGLVYDLKKSDYLKYLCAMNYTPEQIRAVAGKTKLACNNHTAYSVKDLNYPSFAVGTQYNPKGDAVVVKYRRTVTNVGQAGTYEVKTVSPSKLVKIYVNPWKLSFNRTNQKKSYTVTFSVSPKIQGGTHLFGRIEWRDGNNHVVGSPIVFTWNIIL